METLEIHDSTPTGSSQEKSFAWADFLARFEWTWFSTLTFRESVHPEKAAKLFHVWWCMMNQKLYGRRWMKKGQGVRWIRAIEMQKRNVLHYHALIGGKATPALVAREFEEAWWDLAGICRMSLVESQGAALAYVSKYVSKGGQIDLGGPLDDLNYQVNFPMEPIGLTAPESQGRAGGDVVKLLIPGSRKRSSPERARGRAAARWPSGIPDPEANYRVDRPGPPAGYYS